MSTFRENRPYIHTIVNFLKVCNSKICVCRLQCSLILRVFKYCVGQTSFHELFLELTHVERLHWLLMGTLTVTGHIGHAHIPLRKFVLGGQSISAPHQQYSK